MNHLKSVCVLSIFTLATACAAENDASSGSTGEPMEALGGAGGEGGAGAGGAGSGGGDAVGGAGGDAGGMGVGGDSVVYETAVGAAYPAGDGARVLLIDKTGTRSSLFNPSTGIFESGDDIDELEGGLPIDNVVAAAAADGSTYFFSAEGMVTVFDQSQATFANPALLTEALEDIPFTTVGAAFGLGSQLFVFNQGGSQYAAYNLANETWSPVYSFAADFGGGGAPIASVGAAYVFDGAYVLFDVSGKRYCIYAGGGEFSSAFGIDELGDGTLTFTDDR